ncbi:MAG: response regulator [Candidatus Levybacteria bacterium]|nr:response regulator [Candidatus Levybacteria bacterium]
MDKAKILVVEDDDFLREVYVETLSGEGYHIDTAIDGEEGKQKIKQGGYDLILLDIVLPKIDGLAIMRQLKTEGATFPNKKVLFLTNLDKDEEIKEALELGDGYLIKSQLTPGDIIRETNLYLSKNETATKADEANGSALA